MNAECPFCGYVIKLEVAKIVSRECPECKKTFYVLPSSVEGWYEVAE